MYCRRKYRKSHKLLLSLILNKKYFIFKFLYINIVHVWYFALALFYIINITVIYTDTHICVCAPMWMHVKGLCKYVNIKCFPLSLSETLHSTVSSQLHPFLAFFMAARDMNTVSNACTEALYT